MRAAGRLLPEREQFGRDRAGACGLHRGDLLGRHRRPGIEDHALGKEHDAVLAQLGQFVVGKEIVVIVVSLFVIELGRH